MIVRARTITREGVHIQQVQTIDAACAGQDRRTSVFSDGTSHARSADAPTHAVDQRTLSTSGRVGHGRSNGPDTNLRLPICTYETHLRHAAGIYSWVRFCRLAGPDLGRSALSCGHCQPPLRPRLRQHVRSLLLGCYAHRRHRREARNCRHSRSCQDVHTVDDTADPQHLQHRKVGVLRPWAQAV